MKKIALVLCVLSLHGWAVPLRWAQGQTKLDVIYPAISGVSNALWVAADANKCPCLVPELPQLRNSETLTIT